MHRFYAAFLFGALLIFAASIHGQTQPTETTCIIHGRIADPLGAAITRAFVLVHSNRWVKADQVVVLNENGEFILTLKPGLYDFFAASPGFLPFAKIIDTRTCKPVLLKVKMLVDMEHLED